MPNAKEKNEGTAGPAAGRAWRLRDPVRLETERLVLRSMTPADATERAAAWFADSELMRYVILPMYLGREGLETFIRSADNARRLLLGIEWKATGELIGLIKADVRLRTLQAETTTLVGEREFLGRGVGTETRVAVNEFLFATMGMRKLVGRVYGQNKASLAINEKLGYTKEGILRRHERLRTGEWTDVHEFGLLREEWLAQQAAAPARAAGAVPAAPPPRDPREAERVEQARWFLRPEWAHVDWFDRLVDNEFLPPETQRAGAAGLLSRFVAFAAARVPYYRDVFARAGIDPADIRGPEDLPRLPLVTKETIRREGDNLRPDRLPREERLAGYNASSGTTGPPTRVWRTQRSRLMESLMVQRQMRWYRFDPSGSFGWIRIAQDLRVPPKGEMLPHGETLFKDSWSGIGRYFYTGPFFGFAKTNPIDAQIAWLREVRPNYLLAGSAQLEHLALALQEAPPLEGLRGLRPVGEPMTEGMRRRIEEIFGVPAHISFGTDELGWIATWCREGERYHVNSEVCLVEIVDADGNPCAPGEVGRVLVTALANLAMPLIRYDTDDMAVAAGDDPCPCGRTLPSLGPVIGRYSHLAPLPPGTRGIMDAVRAVMESLRPPLSLPLRQYQLHQYADGRFELRLVTDGPVPADLSAQIQKVWREAAPDQPPLAIERVAHIPLAPSFKFFHFTSDFAASGPAAAETGDAD